ncbi:MAG: hypothetical protein CVT63_05630 [Candidatus Anoxymicrobium japonicum]|uniref:Uncharacterized protein n=1 Tax=Candidatus Anoxymicrobium japonicum TaxID=2013648 RepID=A0A2N3G598_9ACTN|nr:MAG: hypothetical protein CVT63_05630 [Candidatus Anoxymicrobium japonicum]
MKTPFVKLIPRVTSFVLFTYNNLSAVFRVDKRVFLWWRESLRFSFRIVGGDLLIQERILVF